MPDPTLAVVAPNFRPKIGGIESFVAGLAANAWPDSTVVVAPPVAGAGSWDATAPFRVQRCQLHGALPPRWRRSRPVVARLARQADVVLCAEWWPAARALASLGRSGGGPLKVLMVHGTEIVAADGRAEASLRRAVRAMDLVIANSAYTASKVADRVGDGPAIEILNPGVDIDPSRADGEDVRRRLGLGDGPIVLTAARLVARKGHVEFAAHWPEVASRVAEAQWVVAGDGPRAAALRQVADPSVHMVGSVDPATLAALYEMADVHLLPGLPSEEVEGFGMAIVEAGAAGTPSVASDLGGTAEALGAGGVIVDGGDLAAMATAVAGLLVDAPRREHLGRQARRRAEELQWGLVADRFRRMVLDRIG